jgi:hypothetical protein
MLYNKYIPPLRPSNGQMDYVFVKMQISERKGRVMCMLVNSGAGDSHLDLLVLEKAYPTRPSCLCALLLPKEELNDDIFTCRA